MKNIVLRSFIVIFSIILTTGCASITRGTNDKLEITTEPSEATVELTRTKGRFTDKQLVKAIGEEKANELLNGEKTYEGPISKTTPTTFVVPRKGEYKLTVSKEGYQPQEVIIGNKVVGKGATGMAGNIILGGLIGIGVDAATGAAKDLTPNPVHVLLVQEGEEAELIAAGEESDLDDESTLAKDTTESTTDQAATAVTESEQKTDKIIEE